MQMILSSILLRLNIQNNGLLAKLLHRRLFFLITVILAGLFLIFEATSFFVERQQYQTLTQELGVKPNFLNKSPNRLDHDTIYEKQVTKALENIEKEILSREGRSTSGIERRIWQLMLELGPGPESRNKNSVLFEEINPGWEYTVRFRLTFEHMILSIFIFL